MNPDTGELRALRRGEKLPEGFEEVPRGRESKEAAMKLRLAALGAAFAAATMQPTARSAHVDLRQGSPLALWAKKKRKAKIAAASRRRNRK